MLLGPLLNDHERHLKKKNATMTTVYLRKNFKHDPIEQIRYHAE